MHPKYSMILTIQSNFSLAVNLELFLGHLDTLWHFFTRLHGIASGSPV